MVKVVTVIGARPQFIKSKPVSESMRGRVEEIVVHTGQHYDNNMSDIFFDELQLDEPKYNIKAHQYRNGPQVGYIISQLSEILDIEHPDYVLVYGDTNSTVAGALAARLKNIPVIHIEAGLRSFDKTMPEEINRIITDQISTMLFCPTYKSIRNLSMEGIKHKDIYNVGDVMADVLYKYKDLAEAKSEILKECDVKENNYYLATIHRQSNADSVTNMETILGAFGRVDKPVIFPVHPRTYKLINKLDIPDNVKLIDPVSYMDMIMLVKSAIKIITDSGGVQKEAYMLMTPCITLRSTTEWVETIDAGWNCLCPIDVVKIETEIKREFVRNNYQVLYGNGNAADKIVNIICEN
jgi:UDP-N-acetylglucosamine 2-epimerase